MATTEPRTGFRLPWSSDDKAASRRGDDQHDVDPSPADTGAPADPASSAEAETIGVSEHPDDTSTTPPNDAPEPGAEGTPVQTATYAAPTGLSVAAPRKPTKFLADLTRAMQAAAETARASALEQLQADAKDHIERVRARSAAAAADLRKHADGDVIGIREWSKAATARIREETELKIADCKSTLERELEGQAAQIEREVDRVQSRVSGYEAEMARFFERLQQQDDPATIAALAENLPEPPPFDADDRAAESVFEAPHEGAAATTPTTESREASEVTEPPVGDDGAGSETTDGAADVPGAPGPDDTVDAVPGPAVDPRLFALGLSLNLDAAEAEAAAAAADSSDDDIPTIGTDALAVRLAGLVQIGAQDPDNRWSDVKPSSSQVVVTGLVSVASIASFKRHLSRIAGVQSVGVSSGPDGEFVFTVAHGAETVLADVVPTLPGFKARVTGTGAGVVNVVARDPESES
jgi:hypothetical protein